MSQSDYPSNEEIEKAAEVVKRLSRGYLPYPLFMAITSKIVTPTLEMVIFQQVKNELHVLLTKRPDDDKHWPGQWHIPGTVLRSTDAEGTFVTCFERILHDELYDLVAITEPKYVSTEFWEIERGRELDQLFYAELKDCGELLESMKFFPVNALPSNLMGHHDTVIAKAIEKRSES
jgi:hypothetical protein